MNKTELAQNIANKVGVSKKEAEEMVEAYVSIVIDTLKSDGIVNIAGFGAFSARTRAGRIGVNPQNPTQKIQIPPVTVPKFKAGKRLKDSLKQGKATEETTPEVEATEAEPETPESTTEFSA
jgi:DNA-binding protein HU-beta